jgi:hypothetical protein
MNEKKRKTDWKDPEVDDDETDDKDDLEEEFVPEAPDGGWGWVVMCTSLLSNFIVDGIGYAFGIILSELAEHLKKTVYNITKISSN